MDIALLVSLLRVLSSHKFHRSVLRCNVCGTLGRHLRCHTFLNTSDTSFHLLGSLLRSLLRREQTRLMRGDYEHDLKARWVKRSVEAEGHEIAIEKRVGDNNDVDFLCRNKEGRLYVIEVCQSGTPKRHIRMAEKAANMNGIDVVFLVADTELVKKLTTLLAKDDPQ